MYSWELSEYIKQRNGKLSKDEYSEINQLTCPQITRVLYNTFTNKFLIYTSDDYVLEFEVYNK